MDKYSLIDWRGLQLFSDTSSAGDGGKMLQNNFTELGRRVGPCKYDATLDPTTLDNYNGDGGNGKYFVGSIWINKRARKKFILLDDGSSSGGNADWMYVGPVDASDPGFVELRFSRTFNVNPGSQLYISQHFGPDDVGPNNIITLSISNVTANGVLISGGSPWDGMVYYDAGHRYEGKLHIGDTVTDTTATGVIFEIDDNYTSGTRDTYTGSSYLNRSWDLNITVVPQGVFIASGNVKLTIEHAS